MLAYFDMLTKRGYLKDDKDNIIFTGKFHELLARAGEHFIEWWDDIPMEDDPRELVALEASRMILGIKVKERDGRKHLKEWGTLTGVILRLLIMMIPDDKAGEMREMLVHDIHLRASSGQYDRKVHPEPTKEDTTKKNP
jgi:hypothetical protein